MAAAALAIVSAPLGLYRVEGLRAAFGQDPDQVDGDAGVAHRGFHRGRIAHIGLHGVDLANPAERLQVPGQFRPANRHPDAVTALRQRPDHVPPQKTRSAKYRDERFDWMRQIRLMSLFPAGQNSRDIVDIPRIRDTPTRPR